MKLSGVVDPVIEEQRTVAQTHYASLLNMNIIFQSILFLIGIPTLLYTIVNLTRREAKRINLFRELDKQNRTLIFDSNKSVDIQDEGNVIAEMIGNLNKAAAFIKNISQGNYDVKWDGLAKQSSNKHNIRVAADARRDEKNTKWCRQHWVSEG